MLWNYSIYPIWRIYIKLMNNIQLNGNDYFSKTNNLLFVLIWKFKFHTIIYVLCNIVLYWLLLLVIMSRYQHRYPWHSLATPSYHPLLPAGLQGYIPYQNRAAVCRFVLVVLPLLVHVKGSTGVYHLWAHPYFSSMSGSSNSDSFRDGW